MGKIAALTLSNIDGIPLPNNVANSKGHDIVLKTQLESNSISGIKALE